MVHPKRNLFFPAEFYHENTVEVATYHLYENGYLMTRYGVVFHMMQCIIFILCAGLITFPLMGTMGQGDFRSMCHNGIMFSIIGAVVLVIKLCGDYTSARTAFRTAVDKGYIQKKEAWHVKKGMNIVLLSKCSILILMIGSDIVYVIALISH